MEEITAEYSLAELSAPVELSHRLRWTIAAKTDMGRVRENNEDKFEWFAPENDDELARRGALFAVADGMGGHNAGQIASELALKNFFDVYFSHPAQEPENAAKAAVEAANHFVFSVGMAIPARRGMGTTLTALALVQGQALIVQVGDSRCYRIRKGEIQQLSAEHTWVEEMVNLGQLTLEEALNHPYKNVITRALGTEGVVVPDIRLESLEEGDIFLLCSDGLTNHVSNPALLETVVSCGLSAACQKLVHAALEDGGSDNCTVLLVRVDEILQLNE